MQRMNYLVSGMIDIGDELIELRSKENFLKITGETAKNLLDQFFSPAVEILPAANTSNSGEVEFTLLRQDLRDAHKFPIMPRPAIIGPFQEKEIQAGSKRNSDTISIVSSLMCLEV